MNYNDIKLALSQLDNLSATLRMEYEENGGEITDSTELKERTKDALIELLNDEGVDYLGRWFKALQDSKKTKQAERDYIDRQIEDDDRCMEYIKGLAYEILHKSGKGKVKGTLGYSFTEDISRTTTINKEALNIIYKEKIQEALTAYRIPVYVTVSLSASSTKADEYGLVDEGDAEIFIKNEKPTVKFLKPVPSKKKNKEQAA